jgi:hydrogenase-1 operon protein HyaF
MSNAIPLKVKNMPEGGTIGGGVKAIAYEILSHLEKLMASGEPAAIDMKSLPMAPEEYKELKNTLGQGELDLVIDVDGPTHLRETAYAGVWWVLHKDPQDQIISEYIEINHIPEFLRAQDDQISMAIQVLGERLKGAS